MKNGPFLQILSVVFGIEHKTLVVNDRFLKEADLIPRGPRGVNALDVTPRDLATHILAALATDKPARVVEMVKHFSTMQMVHPDYPHWLVVSLALGPDHTLLDMVTRICDPDSQLSPDADFRITFVGTIQAYIGAVAGHALYQSRAQMAELEAIDLDDLKPDSVPLMRVPGILTSREISSETIGRLKRFIFQKGEAI